MKEKTSMAISTKVVVACVVFDTYKIVQPIEYLKSAGKVYLIHWTSKRNPKGSSVYMDFYSRNVEMLSDVVGPSNIIEIRAEVYDFKKMLATILSILSEERSQGNEVFINISSGTSEYAAAATLASMMVPGVRPFTVRTKEWQISGEDLLRKLYYQDGVPIGQSRSVYDPEDLPIFHIPMPDRHLVEGLRILDSRIKEKKSSSYTSMIGDLRRAGLWRNGNHEERVTQSDKMYYLRNFLEPWIASGWIEKAGKRSLFITEVGRHVAEMFYLPLPVVE
ncbi:MAG: hypothetical protein A4E29_01320 [Methanomassiliicoccales archaeon PtaB.Bin134]|nr:MAG: hypothetical protein A4E29_01320 [Methanomassiliicoccales archaeon PtaB.Bin134]